LDPPVVQCGLLRVNLRSGKNNQGIILFSGPDESGPSGRGRSDLRIRYSTDEANSWQDGLLIHIGPAAYSDMVQVDADTLAILYEAGDVGNNRYDRIDFLRIPLAVVIKDTRLEVEGETFTTSKGQ
jgi:sialidase-1